MYMIEGCVCGASLFVCYCCVVCSCYIPDIDESDDSVSSQDVPCRRGAIPADDRWDGRS